MQFYLGRGERTLTNALHLKADPSQVWSLSTPGEFQSVDCLLGPTSKDRKACPKEEELFQ